jgi:hypothetical protein
MIRVVHARSGLFTHLGSRDKKAPDPGSATLGGTLIPRHEKKNYVMTQVRNACFEKFTRKTQCKIPVLINGVKATHD